ncbi:rhomboid family intramembrane serine protease [Williamsia sterculiae]|uniref:rhomboid family intramembrane serine protease n=1 Tax=Williamsia sterculiae TaxID=1344003 RepID=UPI00190EEEC3
MQNHGVGASASRSPGDPRGDSTRLWVRSLIVIVAFVAVLYVVEAVDAATNFRLDDDGIRARDVDGLDGILWAPLLHAGWDHLAANTGPAVVLGFLVLLARRFLLATVTVWVISGAGVWLFAPANSITVGLSGVIFGWLTFLLLRGIFNRSGWQILIGVVIFLLYGGVLWGVLPAQESVSWQAHLFGAIGGVVAAWLLRRRGRTPTPAPTPDLGSPGTGR